MTISSMTGFAREEGVIGDRRWMWEIRSVNGRGLEFRYRGPVGFDHIEGDIRRAVSERFARGSISATLAVDRPDGARAFKVNAAVLDQAIELTEEIVRRTGCERPRADGLLSLRGVIEADDGAADEASREQLAAGIKAGFIKALESLASMRRAEGRALQAIINARIDSIESLTAAARANPGTTLAAIKARLEAMLAELLGGAGIPEERLAQEAALLAIRADVREELDRLDAHIGAARALAGAPDPVGRKLDFLSQEFNREANTLCSKAQDLELKRIGLELKTAIDQLREQVQNIE
jgi:uncharacterized protein (TIGR00255 family)